MPEIYPNEKLFLQVIHDLREFMPFFVLVGGWIPFIYAKYVWGNISNLAVHTSDIDFGVLNKEYKGIETITSRVKKLGYGERHVSMDRLIPFTPVIKSKDGSERVEIEFIIDSKVPKAIKEKILGRGIKINKIEYFDILLESITTINIESQIIQIPTESMFVFHKLLTFIQRGKKEKLRKDLYYIYYMLRFCPQKERLLREIQSLIKYKNQGKEVVSNIQKYFSNIDSKGPIFIEQENGPDSFIGNVREDTFKRITQLLI